jgi:hypothetical protein
MKISCLSWLAITLITANLSAQPAPAKAKLGALPDFPASIAPQVGSCSQPDEATRSLCNQATQESYRYLISAYQHRRSSFDWNLAADKIIVLVVSGLVFAAIQFRVGLAGVAAFEPRPSPHAEESAPDEAEVPAKRSGLHTQAVPQLGDMATNLELSANGIKVSSSVLGVIVLLISMAFFYLYARYVYPIQEVRRDQPDVSQGTAVN